MATTHKLRSINRYVLKNNVVLHVDDSLNSPLLSEGLYRENGNVLTGNPYISGNGKQQEYYSGFFDDYQVNKTGVTFTEQIVKYGTSTLGGTPDLELVYKSGSNLSDNIYTITFDGHSLKYKKVNDTSFITISNYIDYALGEKIKIWMLLVGGGGSGTSGGAPTKAGAGGGGAAATLFSCILKKDYTINLVIGEGGAARTESSYGTGNDGKSSTIIIYNDKGNEVANVETSGGKGGIMNIATSTITPGGGGTVFWKKYENIGFRADASGSRGGDGATSINDAGGNGDPKQVVTTGIDYKEPYNLQRLNNQGGSGAPKGSLLAGGGGGVSGSPAPVSNSRGGGYGSSQNVYIDAGYGGGGRGGCGSQGASGAGGHGLFALWCS